MPKTHVEFQFSGILNKAEWLIASVIAQNADTVEEAWSEVDKLDPVVCANIYDVGSFLLWSEDENL